MDIGQEQYGVTFLNSLCIFYTSMTMTFIICDIICLLSAFIKLKWWYCVADCVVLERRSSTLWNVHFV